MDTDDPMKGGHTEGDVTTEIRFDLFYRYRFQDNGGSFIAGPPVGVPHLLAQTQQFMVRDICSETQHLAR
jgi:hypothetical protein